MVCCFFGHGYSPNSIRGELKAQIIRVISEFPDTCFYVGNQGQFDAMVRGIMRELIREGRQVRYSVVLAYMPKVKPDYLTRSRNTEYDELRRGTGGVHGGMERMEDRGGVGDVSGGTARGEDRSGAGGVHGGTMYEKVYGAGGIYDESDTIYPEGLESVPPRFAINWRNNWMLSRADMVICYVTTVTGGAAKFVDKARRKGLRIVNIADLM